MIWPHGCARSDSLCFPGRGCARCRRWKNCPHHIQTRLTLGLRKQHKSVVGSSGIRVGHSLLFRKYYSLEGGRWRYVFLILAVYCFCFYCRCRGQVSGYFTIETTVVSAMGQADGRVLAATTTYPPVAKFSDQAFCNPLGKVRWEL
jgi:hypothetical protein